MLPGIDAAWCALSPNGYDGSVARQVVVVTNVFEAAVTDVVLAAGFKIKVPPLTGGGTMKDDQGNASHRANVLNLVAGIQAQGSGYGRGYGDDYFDDDLPNVFFHNLQVFKVKRMGVGLTEHAFFVTFAFAFAGFFTGFFPAGG